jgi:two-component system response regulator MprA
MAPAAEVRVIVLEDDPGLRSVLGRGLREAGFAVETAGAGAELLRRLEAGATPDAAVVDIGLPDADGRDVVQALRARGLTLPVLFLSARDALPDRLSGFAAGGDDYLTKPFALAELVARLQALLRRSGATTAVASGSLRLDPASHDAEAGGIRVPLTPTEFRLLAHLTGRSGEVVRRGELVAAGWPHGAIVSHNTLDQYVRRIRRKLERLPGSAAIQTVRGVGYRLG